MINTRIRVLTGLIYLFRLARKRYPFNEIIGFRFKYLTGRIDYKSLQFRTADGKKFTVSDLETANLRELEGFCLDRFELRAGKEFRPLTQEERQAEIDKSIAFDLSQAKHIRWYYYGLTLFGLIVTFLLARGFFQANTTLTAEKLLPLMIMIAIPVIIVPRIIRINKRIQKLRPHEPS